MLFALRYIFLFVVLVLETAGLCFTSSSKQGWKAISPAPRDTTIKLHIATRQEDDGAEIEKVLLSISDPKSRRFRQHLSSSEAAHMSAAAEDSIHIIHQWLDTHAVSANRSLVNGILEIDTTIATAQRLLNATYAIFSDGTKRIIRTDSYHLPDGVADHTDFITPTTTFPRPAKAEIPFVEFADKRQESVNSNPALFVIENDNLGDIIGELTGCGANGLATPTCIRQAYDINYQAQPNRTTFAVYGTEAASFSANDLQTYLGRYNQPAALAKATYEVVEGVAGTSGIEAQFETALDTQTLLGIAWPASGILYNNGGVFGSKPGQVYDNFVNFLQQLIVNATVPSVVSFSESMPEDMLDPNYAKRLCSMMAQVGARGVTLLFSSGDNGANGDQPTGQHLKIFEPEFPASCPWVTSVGGTTNLVSETAATKSTISLVDRISYTASGGGFSNLFPIPEYQKSVVANYVSTHIPQAYSEIPGFNGNGRGIPDVSAFSTNFPTVFSLLTVPISGTSASTPLWAAVITLLNDYEASRGRPNLGFINPWLYNLTMGLKDITTGGNNAGSCLSLGGCYLPETLGYNVTVGWDPVTGLGSPLFKDLQETLDKTSC